MSQLRQQLRQIVTQFVSAVLDAMSHGALAEFVQSPGIRVSRHGGPGRRHIARPLPPATTGGRARRSRATAEEVQRQKDLALETARTLSPGFRKGDVMKRSGSRADLGRALSLLVKEGKLSKKGDRRKARYWVS
jgi:hypothetical protein